MILTTFVLAMLAMAVLGSALSAGLAFAFGKTKQERLFIFAIGTCVIDAIPIGLVLGVLGPV